MKEYMYIRNEGALEPMESSLLPLLPVSREASGSALEYIKPQFRERLVPLVPWGLLAEGVRIILQENGFGPETRRHCGCPRCAWRRQQPPETQY
jgi:hypothetical protein